MYMFTDHQDDAFSSKHTTIQNRAKRTIMGKLIDYELMHRVVVVQPEDDVQRFVLREGCGGSLLSSAGAL